MSDQWPVKQSDFALAFGWRSGDKRHVLNTGFSR
jgi:hypothetical protein